MKSFITNWVGWLLIFAIFGFYYFGLGWAIQLSWLGPIAKDGYPSALSVSISSIQALLLTNLGALLGISITNRQSNIARALMLHVPAIVGGGDGGAPRMPAPPPNPMDIREKIQLMALVIYVIGLLACFITWVHGSCVTDDSRIVDLVSQAGKMFIGVALAYLTAVLGR